MAIVLGKSRTNKENINKYTSQAGRFMGQAAQNIAGSFIAATEAITDAALKNKNYDTTVLCRVVEQVKENEYIVTYNSTKFNCYCQNKIEDLKVGDRVYVLFPGGETNAQKIIISKYVENDKSKYVKPEDEVVQIQNFSFATDATEKEKRKTIYPNSSETKTFIGRKSINSQLAFTKLYIKADFQTFGLFPFKSNGQTYSTIEGSYGLEIKLNLNNGESSRILTFDNTNFIGNTYNFDFWFSQSIAYNISDIGANIRSIEVYLFQKEGSFKGQNGVLVSYNSNRYIQVKDIDVAFGYEQDDFKRDVNLFIYDKDNNLHYTNNNAKKNIAIVVVKKNNNDNRYSVIETNELEKNNYQIKFKKYDTSYSPSEDSDESEEKNWCPLEISAKDSIQLDVNSSYTTIKVELIKTGTEKEVVASKEIQYINDDLAVSIMEKVEKVNDDLAVSIREENQISLKLDRNYFFVYNSNGTIIDDFKGKIFKATLQGIASKDIGKIEWSIEKSGSFDMLTWVQEESNQIAADSPQIKEFSLNNYYSPGNNAGSIKCTITTKNNVTITVSSPVYFGYKSTNGSQYVCFIELNKPALYYSSEKEVSSLVATFKVFTSVGEEILPKKVDWKLDESSEIVKISGVNDTSNTSSQTQIKIQNGKKIDVSDLIYNLLYLTASTTINNIKLEKQIAIPISFRTNLAYITGATEIIYNDAGQCDFYETKNYAIYNNKGKMVEDTIIRLISNKGLVESNDFPKIIGNKYIVPSPFYVKENKKYAIIIIDSADNNNVLWCQPLLIWQNVYKYDLINEWDGALKIDEKNNGFFSSFFVAGNKNSDNEFNGVVLGETKKTATTDFKVGTGLIGFKNGAQVFGFLDSGEAFIGLAGKGRIEFDGDKATIKGGTFESNDYDEDYTKLGMLIDLREASICSRNFKVDSKGNVKITGEITATSGSFTGAIYANEGCIGQWTINQEYLSGGKFTEGTHMFFCPGQSYDFAFGLGGTTSTKFSEYRDALSAINKIADIRAEKLANNTGYSSLSSNFKTVWAATFKILIMSTMGAIEADNGGLLVVDRPKNSDDNYYTVYILEGSKNNYTKIENKYKITDYNGSFLSVSTIISTIQQIEASKIELTTTEEGRALQRVLTKNKDLNDNSSAIYYNFYVKNNGTLNAKQIYSTSMYSFNEIVTPQIISEYLVAQKKAYIKELVVEDLKFFESTQYERNDNTDIDIQNTLNNAYDKITQNITTT